MIPSIGPMEMAILLIVGIVVFGPKKLPELGRSLGRGIREFGDGVTGRDAEPGLLEAAPGGDEAVPQTAKRDA